LDIVLLHAEHPLGNGRILPAGSLREGPSALGRAGAIGFNGLEDEDRLATLARWADETVGRAVPVFGVRRRLSFLGASSGVAERRPQGPVAALSSIGRPRQFEESLISHGIDVEVALRFPDHHRYRGGDVGWIEAALRTRGLERMVTTEKDWVKLREVGAPGAHLWIARLEVSVFGQNPVEKCEKPQVSPAASL
jgi:tetraacyldisaccharide 4'-kinase